MTYRPKAVFEVVFNLSSRTKSYVNSYILSAPLQSNVFVGLFLATSKCFNIILNRFYGIKWHLFLTSREGNLGPDAAKVDTHALHSARSPTDVSRATQSV